MSILEDLDAVYLMECIYGDWNYLGEDEKTPEAHEYRACLWDCFKASKEKMKQQGKGTVRQRLKNCIEDCNERYHISLSCLTD